MKSTLIAVVTAATVLFAATAPALASQRPSTSIDCAGLGTVQVVTPVGGDQNDPWGAAQIVGDGHLIPTSFRFVAHDSTVGSDIYDSGLNSKGAGNANHNQQPITCSTSQTTTLRALWGPGQLPPGTSDDDIVTLTFTVTGIAKAEARS